MLRTGRRRLVGGMALVATGLVVLLVGFLQPWASCPGIDDSSAGCPAGSATRIVMTSGMVLGGLGAAVLAVEVASTHRRKPRDHD